jgi:glycosyltransferase involved in cell wall biosynthesis
VAAGCVEVVGVSAVVLASLRRGRPRGLRRPRLAVVPNGVPEPRAARAAARAAIGRELSLPAGAPLVALLGRLHAAKGQLELVDAAPALLEKVPEAQLLLVGGDDPTQAAYAGSVRARVRSAALRGHVHLLGHRDDAEALVAAADVLAVPSVQDERGMGREGFGLAGVEALAAGTPVVGYADGALPEVLGDAAVLVAPGDRAALAQALAALLTDEARRATLVRRGRARYEARFRLDVTAAAMAERYRSAVGQRSTEP